MSKLIKKEFVAKSLDLFDRRENTEVVELELSQLRHYKHHHFELYGDEKLRVFAENVKNTGLLVPLLVRKVQTGYEILSGHNRFEALKINGESHCNCIVIDADDVLADIIVVESNDQRSLDEIKISNRVKVLARYHEAIKKQGKRTDLTCGHDDHKLSARVVVAEKYQLSPKTIERYVRLSKLKDDFLIMLDQKILSINAAYNLSFLSPDQQQVLLGYILSNTISIKVADSEKVRALATGGELSEVVLSQLMNQHDSNKKSMVKEIKLMINKYFKGHQSIDEAILIIIEKALIEYINQENED